MEEPNPHNRPLTHRRWLALSRWDNEDGKSLAPADFRFSGSTPAGEPPSICRLCRSSCVPPPRRDHRKNA